MLVSIQGASAFRDQPLIPIVCLIFGVLHLDCSNLVVKRALVRTVWAEFLVEMKSLITQK